MTESLFVKSFIGIIIVYVGCAIINTSKEIAYKKVLRHIRWQSDHKQRLLYAKRIQRGMKLLILRNAVILFIVAYLSYYTERLEGIIVFVATLIFTYEYVKIVFKTLTKFIRYNEVEWKDFYIKLENRLHSDNQNWLW